MAIALVGAGSATAASVTAVSFTSNSYVSANPAATWTIGFTPASPLASGNAVFVEFDGFDLSGPITATLATGFAGSCGTPVDSVTATYVVISLPAGCSLAAATPATLTIAGIQSAFNQYTTGVIGAFRVLTYTDATGTTPIDTAGAPSPGGLHITAQTTYSSMTSAGGATSGGTPPATTTNTVADTTVIVAGNAGALTLTGYAFDGWCTTNNAADPTLCTGTHYAAAGTFNIAANTTLYSTWAVAYAADGSGTNVVTPTSAVVASANNTLTFTYTAANGGMNSGEVDVEVPAGWSAPTSAATPGCTTASSGTLSFAGQTIKVSSLTLPAGGTLTIVYGATSGGACVAGNGANAQVSTGVVIFTTTHKATAGGVLTAIAASPAVTVSACAAGHYLSGGACKHADPGYFVADAGATSQTPCPAGSYSVLFASTSCIPARPGYYSEGVGRSNEMVCGGGTFSALPGAARCTPAPPGSYVGTFAATSATPCAVNTYAPMERSMYCGPCPVGSSTDGATGATKCTAAGAPVGFGPIELVWTDSDSAVVRIGIVTNRTRIVSWKLEMVYIRTTGACPPSGTLPTEIVQTIASGAAGRTLAPEYAMTPPRDMCTRYRLTASDNLGDVVVKTSAWQSQAMGAVSVKTTIKLAQDISTKTNDFTNSFISELSKAVGVSTSRFTTVQVTAGSLARRTTDGVPAHMFKVSSKRLPSGKLRITVGNTKVGRAYLAKHPSLRGTRVRMQADFVVRLKGVRTPVKVTRTFMMRIPLA